MSESLFERLLTYLFELRTIVNCERDPYLRRWYLWRSEPLGVFIHKFIRSDEDRALHDHPWSFVVIPLWRGYREHSDAGCRRVFPIIGARWRKADFRHRVELIDALPAWSLFIRFRKRSDRDWGFWTPTGFIEWNKWWQEKCE